MPLAAGSAGTALSEVVRVELFGGVRVVTAAGEAPAPSMRAGALLAALVMARGARVGLAELTGLLWPSGEPASAANQLHRLVGQVRRLFEPGLPPRDVGAFVVGSSAGYRLNTSLVHSDVDDCDAGVKRARGLAGLQDWEAASEQYAAALAILQHPLLGDATWEATSHPGFSATTRTRIAVASESLACARRGGRLQDALALVERIASAVPFEEGLQADLVTALAQAGRRGDALLLYERVRSALVHELGVDPGPELRAAHQQLLSPDGVPPASGPLPGGTSAARPAQLPASLRGMIARPEAQKLLDEVSRLGESATVAITAIGGMGGIGKTTLAVFWARSLAPRFPDGQLYVNLRGFDPTGQVLSPMDALGELLLSLGAAPVETAESLESRSARFRGLLAERSVLLLLDNARDAEQVRPLLPNSPGCLVIVTSRNQLPSLIVREGAVPVRLDKMTDSQARDLLTRRLGAVRMDLEPAAAGRIIAAAAGLPLALALVAARLALDPLLSLEAVADELTTSPAPDPGLPRWSAGEPRDDLASVFDWSYDLLDGESARFFRLLAVHPGPELSIGSVASVTGLDIANSRRVISRLVGASLLERRGPDLIVLHDLMRAYADGQLGEGERAGAQARLVGHYVRSTRNAWDAHGRPPVGELDPVAGTAGLHPDSFESFDDTIAWYIRERTVLASVLHLAIARGWHRAAANIAIDWRPMNQTVDLNSYTYPLCLTALSAAERTGDPVLCAELHRDAGPKAARLGDLAGGQEHLEKARSIFALIGDRSGEANTLRNLVTLPTVSRRAGVRYLREAVSLVQHDEGSQVLHTARITLAGLLTAPAGDELTEDDFLEAVKLLEQSLPVIRQSDWTYLIPIASANLAHALSRLSRPREALEVARAALDFAGSSPAELALLLGILAGAALAAEEHSAAADACREYRKLSQRHGPDQLDDLLAQQKYGAAESASAAIQRVEEALIHIERST